MMKKPTAMMAIIATGKKKPAPRDMMLGNGGGDDANEAPGAESDDEYPGEEGADMNEGEEEGEGQVEFKAPDNWRPPSGKVPGDIVRSMVELKLKPNGMLCLTKLDGSSMPGYEDENSESEQTTDQGNGMASDGTAQPSPPNIMSGP